MVEITRKISSAFMLSLTPEGKRFSKMMQEKEDRACYDRVNDLMIYGVVDATAAANSLIKALGMLNKERKDKKFLRRKYRRKNVGGKRY